MLKRFYSSHYKVLGSRKDQQVLKERHPTKTATAHHWNKQRGSYSVWGLVTQR